MLIILTPRFRFTLTFALIWTAVGNFTMCAHVINDIITVFTMFLRPCGNDDMSVRSPLARRCAWINRNSTVNIMVTCKNYLGVSWINAPPISRLTLLPVGLVYKLVNWSGTA